MKKFLLMNLFWGIVILLSMLCLPLSPITNQIPTVDSSIFITCSQWISEGLVMYRDVFDHKGPIIYLFDLLGIMIGGLTGVWILSVVWVLVTTNLSFYINRLFCGERYSFIAATFLSLVIIRTGGDNTVELVAMPFISLCYYLMIKSLLNRKEISVRDMLLISSSFACILLLKPNLGAGIAFLALIIIYRLMMHFNVRVFLKYMITMIVGVAIIFIPLYLYLSVHDAWNDFISTYWTFNLEYSSVASTSQKWNAFKLLFFIYIPSLFSWLFIIGTIASIFIKQLKWGYIGILVGMLLFTGYFTVGISGFNFGHYLLPVIPLFSLFIAYFFSIWKNNNHVLRISMAALLLFCVYIGIHMHKTYVNSTDNMQNVSTNELVRFVKNHTEEDDRICLYNVDSNIYYFSGRKSITKYIYQTPIFSFRKSMKKEYLKNIQNGKPELLVLNKGNLSDIPTEVIEEYKELPSPDQSILIFKRL